MKKRLIMKRKFSDLNINIIYEILKFFKLVIHIKRKRKNSNKKNTFWVYSETKDGYYRYVCGSKNFIGKKKVPRIDLFGLYGKWGSNNLKHIIFLFRNLNIVFYRNHNSIVHSNKIIEEIEKDMNDIKKLEKRASNLQVDFTFNQIYNLNFIQIIKDVLEKKFKEVIINQNEFNNIVVCFECKT